MIWYMIMTNPQKPAKRKKLKNEGLFESYKRVTEEFLKSKGYRPLTFSELATRLSIIEGHLELFKEVVNALIEDKKAFFKNGLIEITSTPKTKENEESTGTRGVIRMHPRGFGFVELENKAIDQVDIFIPAPYTMNAVDGDKVEIQISSQQSEKGPEGKVLKILSRSRTHLAGTVIDIRRDEVYVYVPLLGIDQQVILEVDNSNEYKVGDRLVMEVLQWGGQKEATHCRLSHKLGHISDPTIDVQAAIEEFEIRSLFSEVVKQEALVFGKTVSSKAIKGRDDLRALEIFTIDPDTAKDYDDALSLKKDEKGHYHLGVHIADVSHYVEPDSELDREAFLRANSTYFPGKAIPMLPSELSDNLCSLKAKVNRLTVSVYMEFDTHGHLIDYRIARSVIKSVKRFTYKEAKKVLDGKAKSPHLPTLLLMVELCNLLKKQRYHRGSVEFAMPELVILVDKGGVPTGTDYVEYDITHQLVEEFMLKANEMVAIHLDKQGKGLPFRVHDEPSEDNMRDFSLLAAAFGFKLPLKPNSKDIQKLFDEALQTPAGQYLATSYIRRMRLAIYSPINIGHFGLALTHYCHFTSPIRRYVDLVAHRLLFNPAQDPKVLHLIAERCSERERISARAENSVILLKKYRLLEDYYKKDPKREYEAVITKVKPFGFFFEVLEIMLEGFIHISEIGIDYYEFNEKNNQLYGVDFGEQFIAGSKISVIVKDFNLITCESSWERVAEPLRKPKKDVYPRNKKKTRKR